MNKHYLSPLFSPRSVAVIGASSRVDSVGGVVFKNMLENGYRASCIRLIRTMLKYKVSALMPVSN